VHGSYGLGLADPDRLVDRPGVERTSTLQEVRAMVGDELTGDLDTSLAACVHALSDGTRAVHLLNYDYDEESDETRQRRDVEVTQEFAAVSATLHRPGRQPEPLPVTNDRDGRSTVVVPELDVYAVVHLSPAD